LAANDLPVDLEEARPEGAALEEPPGDRPENRLARRRRETVLVGATELDRRPPPMQVEEGLQPRVELGGIFDDHQLFLMASPPQAVHVVVHVVLHALAERAIEEVPVLR